MSEQNIQNRLHNNPAEPPSAAPVAPSPKSEDEEINEVLNQISDNENGPPAATGTGAQNHAPEPENTEMRNSASAIAEKMPQKMIYQFRGSKSSLDKAMGCEPEKNTDDISTEMGIELPHQEHDIRPEEIVEHEQEPPDPDKSELPLPSQTNAAADIDMSGSVPPPVNAMQSERPDDAGPGPRPFPPTSNDITPAGSCDYCSDTGFIARLKRNLVTARRIKRKNMLANLDKITEYARKTQTVTNDDVERLTGIKHRQATRYLNMLVREKRLVRFGSGKNTFYKPIEHDH